MEHHSHLNWIELSRRVLKKNVSSLARLAGNRTVAVSVKANAYGHGLRETANILKECPEVSYLTVHSVEEATIARQAGWVKKIMLLGPVASENIEAVFEFDLEPVIFERRILDRLGKFANKTKKPLRTHLKLETGTNRQGITGKDLPDFAETYHKYPYLKRPYGASTHFANIEDTTRHDYAQHQLDNFNLMTKQMNKLGIKPAVRHTASSAALILFEKTRFELVRPGIAAYGYWPSKETFLSYLMQGGHNDLFEPVLSWKTRITQIKKLPADSFIGYGCTYRTTSPTRLAVIPIGYYDGLDRHLSNRAYVLIKGKRAPVRGRICMNLTMVDISDIKNVKPEEEVTIIGQSGNETISANHLADWANTINYEILARLSSTTPRVII